MIPSTTLSEEDKTALEEEIAHFKSEDDDAKTTATYVPILLDDKVAHGHYDGYCKQSEILIETDYRFHLISCPIFSSSLAALPLSPLARCLPHLALGVFLSG
jgi:trehalose 6-phosphate synthase/phosphatase